jgi:uncharacterized membrane protein
VGSPIQTLEAILIPWLVLLHLLGVILWVAGLLSVTLLLSGIGDADKNLRDKVIELAGKLERTLALPGFLLAMVFGFILLFGNALGHSPLRQGWMHMKLTVVLLGLLRDAKSYAPPTTPPNSRQAFATCSSPPLCWWCWRSY